MCPASPYRGPIAQYWLQGRVCAPRAVLQGKKYVPKERYGEWREVDSMPAGWSRPGNTVAHLESGVECTSSLTPRMATAGAVCLDAAALVPLLALLPLLCCPIERDEEMQPITNNNSTNRVLCACVCVSCVYEAILNPTQPIDLRMVFMNCSCCCCWLSQRSICTTKIQFLVATGAARSCLGVLAVFLEQRQGLVPRR